MSFVFKVVNIKGTERKKMLEFEKNTYMMQIGLPLIPADCYCVSTFISSKANMQRLQQKQNRRSLINFMQ